MLIVADVHGAFGALGRVVRLADQRGEPLLILGDLVNLVDYRTNLGIVSDVIGIDLMAEISALRGDNHREQANALWKDRMAGREHEVEREVATRMATEYAEMRASLGGGKVFVTYGNVDDPEMLRANLPVGATFVDAEVVEISGQRVGFVGGGVPRIGSRGEVSDDEMREKLRSIGPVDILCTHVPPAIPMLASDVIGGTFKGSDPILDYLEDHPPAYHFFGDVHQPRATRWQQGETSCVNVGYFRATGRPFHHG